MTASAPRSYVAGSMILTPRLARQILRRSSEERLGVDLRLLMALSYLGDHDGAPQQDLDDVLCMDAKNVVLLLNELEDQDLITRRRDRQDRRRHRVELTTAGRDALDRASNAQKAIEDDVLQALDAEDRAALRSLLARALQGAEPTDDTANAAPAAILT